MAIVPVIHLLLYSCIRQIFIKANYVASTVLAAKNTAVYKNKQVPVIVELTSSGVRQARDRQMIAS